MRFPEYFPGKDNNNNNLIEWMNDRIINHKDFFKILNKYKNTCNSIFMKKLH